MNIRTILIVCVVFSLAACASSGKISMPHKQEILTLFANNNITNISHIEKYWQEQIGNEPQVLTIEAISKEMETSYGGCSAVFTTADLTASGDSWKIESIESRNQVSLVPCVSAKSLGFAEVIGDADAPEMATSLVELKKLFRSKRRNALASFQNNQVQSVFYSAKIADLDSISITQDNVVRLDFIVSGFAPRILQIEMTFKNERIEKIYIYSENELEVIKS